MTSIRYALDQPVRKFRWAFRDSDESWHLREPPNDWTIRDYESARPDGRSEPELADKFFLVAPLELGGKPREGKPWSYGEFQEEPGLYLEFASTEANPSRILDYANRLGLLRRLSSVRVFAADKVQNLWRQGSSSETFSPSSSSSYETAIFAEPALDWLKIFEALRYLISSWEDLADKPLLERRKFLDFKFHFLQTAQLAFRLDIDPNSGEPFTELLASSLADLVWIQWGLSVAAHVHHKQCAQCERLFAVHPGSGRPDKRFCSVACRMRDYRSRKTQRGHLTPSVVLGLDDER